MTTKRTYVQIKKELDEVLYSFESSSHADVDEMLVDYEKASNLIKELQVYLDTAEKTLVKLNKKV